MLDNDPPPGTQVRFIREIRKRSPKNVAILKESLDPGRPELPSDRFRVEVDGEIITVRREDIQLVDIEESKS
jgi:hypothetical protein